MEKIREYLSSIAHMSDRDWQIFSSKLIKREFPKQTVLLKSGETERYVSFIETGIVRYYIPKDDNDITFSFTFSNSFTSVYDSFLTQGPSPYQIEPLTNVILWRLTYDDLQHIYADTEVGQTIGRHICEFIFLIKSKRELSLLNDTAEQRYLNLFIEEPYLIKHIPLKYIASYIGVTPQGLSRIRRRIT